VGEALGWALGELVLGGDLMDSARGAGVYASAQRDACTELALGR
jgi:hypothetical protein